MFLSPKGYIRLSFSKSKTQIEVVAFSLSLSFELNCWISISNLNFDQPRVHDHPLQSLSTTPIGSELAVNPQIEAAAFSLLH